MSISANIEKLRKKLPADVTLVAVSKTKSPEEIMEAYHCGQRDFGENYVQELIDKYEKLPKDIRWHFIGHLQSNKVKYIAPFVHLIHGVDSFKLLKEINKQAQKNNRVIDCLLQIHIAKEETKFGLNEMELSEIINSAELPQLENICINGLMGMASNTNVLQIIKVEFSYINKLFSESEKYSTFNFQPSTLSTGMSSDYPIAIDNGSNMVRIGSLIFGKRNYKG